MPQATQVLLPLHLPYPVLNYNIPPTFKRSSSSTDTEEFQLTLTSYCLPRATLIVAKNPFIPSDNMPAPVQVALRPIELPSIGRNNYQKFAYREEILPKGWNGYNSRPLPCDIHATQDMGVKVRDGCTLYCDIYRPADTAKPVPAILAWSPFGKKFNGISMLQNLQWNMGVPKGALRGLEKFEGPDPAVFVPRGFAIVNVDARGAGDSDGSVVIMGTQEAEDGYDVIEAIAKLPWCNGNVGLAGNSHLAIVQWFIAALKPPSLKAIAPGSMKSYLLLVFNLDRDRQPWQEGIRR
jgi:predicted acyl esterase